MSSKLDTSLFTASVFYDKGRGEPDPVTGLPRYDCFGLFRAVLMHWGIFLDNRNISCDAVEQINGHIGLAILDEWERLSEPEEGCAVVFLSTNPDYPTGFVDHLGVYIGYGEVIHTQRKTGAKVTPLSDRFWSKKVAGYYRYIGQKHVQS